MYRIAVCDDEKIVCDQIAAYLTDYITAGTISVEKYYSVEDLYDEISKGICFNIIFLDILFGAPKGIELGVYIREKFKIENIHIVYISGKEEYAMELFKTRPLDFLIKPLSKEHVIRALEKSIELTELENQYFSFRTENSLIQLPFRDIKYFESNARKIIITGIDSSYEFYGKLDDVQESICSKFYRIHQSYLVNHDHIKQFMYDRVILYDGEDLVISKRYRNKIRRLLLEEFKQNE